MGAFILASGILPSHLPAGQGLFWNDRHFSAWIFADAFSRNLGMVAQLDVNDPALIGWHRFQDLPPPGFDCLVCHPAGKLANLLGSAGCDNPSTSTTKGIGVTKFLARNQTGNVL